MKMRVKRNRSQRKVGATPHGPIRTMDEVADLLNLTFDQVRYIEACAFNKIRAALSAYGYHREIGRVRR